MPTRRELIKLEGRERNDKVDRPVELGRRADSVFSSRSNIRDDFDLSKFGDGFDRDYGGGGDEEDLTFGLGGQEEGEDLGGFDAGANNFDLDLGLDDVEAIMGESGKASSQQRAKKQKTSHAGDGEREVTPARSVGSGRGIFEDDEKVYRSEGPLAIFDELGSGRTVASSQSLATATPSRSQAASQSLATEEEEAAAAATQTETLTQKTGSISLQSRNTRKAVKVIQEQLDIDDAVEKKVEFNKVAEKVNTLVSLGSLSVRY